MYDPVPEGCEHLKLAHWLRTHYAGLGAQRRAVAANSKRKSGVALKKMPTSDPTFTINN